MATKNKAGREAPDRVTQQSEQSFPASDSPSFSPGAIGAPVNRHTPRVERKDAIAKAAETLEKAKTRKRPTA